MKKLSTLLILLYYFNTYSAHYLIEHKDNKVHVTATFDANELSGHKIKLYVPQIIWGTNFKQQITNLKTNGIYDAKNQLVSLQEEQKLFIRYDIISLSKSTSKLNFSNLYAHLITKDKFYMLGMGLFIYPDKFNGDVVIKIKSKIPYLACNKPPYFPLDNIINTNTADLNSLVIIGSKDLSYFTKENMNVILWSNSPLIQHQFKNLALPAFKRHEQFWQIKPQQYLAIIFSHFKPDKKTISMRGTAIDKNTILFFAPSNINYADFSFILRHEHLHFWFGRLLHGPQWFIEGFTNYYLEKINLHYNGNLAHFIGSYNQQLKQYFSSPAYKLNDKEIEESFFNISIAQELPYIKGYLIAGQLDSIIDLDSALRRMMQKCEQNAKYCEFNTQNLLDCAGKLSESEKKLIKNLIEDFNSAPLSKSLTKSTELIEQKIFINKPTLDIFKLFNTKKILGKELNKISNKYEGDKIYKIRGINFDYQAGKGSLTINVNNKKEKLLVPFKKVETKIPYYSSSKL